MTCRTCKFLDVKPDKIGRVIPRSTFMYRCLAPLPDYIAPACFEIEVMQRRMTIESGKGCTFHEPRTKK